MKRREFLRLAAGSVAWPAAASIASAESYPSRPVTMIVPFAAGGPTDVIARIVAEGMRPSLGQPVLIENVGGAAGNIGVARVARAAPDGYTICVGMFTTHVINAAIYTLGYDVVNDFEPVALLVSQPSLIVSRKTLPASDLNGLIAYLKANPGAALAGTGGVGTPPHIFGLFFQHATDTRFRFVPYRGAGPALQDLVAGHLDVMIDVAGNSLPQIRGGTIKVYAVAAKSRLAAAADIPTVDEAGLPGLYFSVWYALWVPKGTPKDIVATLNTAVTTALADPAVRARLTGLGQEIFPRGQQTPEALGAFQKAEIAKWWPIIKAAGIKAE
ncbi:MAG TPA: tripartite tricarboxylate transporter substrate-binding protein [Xanthobacteraceae bacterium]|jgi:tripartite-type tricarboxylate transporter receptor subunit TctC